MRSRPPVQLSHTGITVLGCGRHAQAKLLKGKRGAFSSPQARFGTMGHLLAEQYVAHLQRKRKKRDWEKAQSLAASVAEALPEADHGQLENCARSLYKGLIWDKAADLHEVERGLACTRDFRIIEDPQFDQFGNFLNLNEDVVTIRMDMRITRDQGRRVSIWDFKMGEEHVDAFTARDHWQGRFYCGMDALHNPQRELQEFRLWGVRYGPKNMSIYSEYRPEYTLEWFKQRVTIAFARLDRYWELYGNRIWAETPCPSACNYCDQAHLCRPNLADIRELMGGPMPERTTRRLPRRKADDEAA